MLPILELPFVWEMNSKLIKKKKKTIREGRGMGLGKRLRFFYSEVKTRRNPSLFPKDLSPVMAAHSGVPNQVKSMSGPRRGPHPVSGLLIRSLDIK